LAGRTSFSLSRLRRWQQVLEDRRADVKVFQKGAAKRQDIEAEFRKFRKSFDLDRFGVMLP